MPELPPEDKPDTIDIGPVTDIPIIHDDDPRFEDQRRAWSLATAKAQALHSTDELLAGLGDADWMVRYEVVDRLIAQGRNDSRTVPALIEAARDSVAAVREVIVMGLRVFNEPGVRCAIEAALADTDADVRWAAQWALSRFDLDIDG